MRKINAYDIFKIFSSKLLWRKGPKSHGTVASGLRYFYYINTHKEAVREKAVLNPLEYICIMYPLAYPLIKQGRKRSLDTPKRIIERRDREKESEREKGRRRDIEREGEIRERERERKRERCKGYIMRE